MPHGFALRERIEIRFQLLRPDAVIARQPIERGLWLAQSAIELGAVTGRQDCCLPDRRLAPNEPGQS